VADPLVSLLDLYSPCLAFAGTGYVDCGNVHAFERTSPFSIGAWIRKTDAGASRAVVSKLDPAAAFRGYELFVYSTNVVGLNLINANTTNHLSVIGSTNVADGLWHYVEATYDGSSTPAGIVLYVDGRRETMTTLYDSLSATMVSTAPLRVGARADGTLAWVGEIDDVRVFTFVRTQDQIRADFRQELLGTTGGLAAYWKFNEGQGTVAGNTANSAQAGTITNGTWVSYSRPLYRFSSAFHETLPEYTPRITEPVHLRQFLPEVGTGVPGDEEATVSCSLIERASSPIPTLAEILAIEDFTGWPARVRVRNVAAGTDVATLFGVVAQVDLRSDSGTLTVRSQEEQLFQTLVPRVRVLDRYPSADLSTSGTAELSELVPFGVWRKVDLALCLKALLKCDYTFPATLANNFRYDDLSSITNYQVQTGDHLYYDVWWPAGAPLIALDLGLSTGATLRGSGQVDQNGLSAHPNTDLSARMQKGWYRRKIPLPAAWVGATVTEYLVACEANAAGSYTGYLHNAFIGDGDGVIRKHIITDSHLSLTTALHLQADAGNTATYTFTRHYYYGPIKPPRPGKTTTVRTVYRDGRVVPASEYAVVDLLSRFVRFPVDQRDGSGRLMRIQADLVTTDFDENFATVTEWLLSDATHGLGKAVDAAGFAAAAADYAAVSYKCGGGLDRQVALADLLPLLLVRGAHLTRGAAGAYTEIVDSAAAHPNAPIALGAGDGVLENLDPGGLERAPVPLESRVKLLELKGAFDPGFSGGGSYLLTAERTEGTRGEEVREANPFLADAATVDREADYRFKVARRLADPLVAVALSRAQVLQLRQVVSVTIPKYRYTQRSFMVAGLEVQGLRIGLFLRAWDAGVFTYTPSAITVPRGFDTITDYSFTFPATPANFTNDIPLTSINSNGVVESRIRVHADAPAVNVTELVFRAIRAGQQAIRSERRVTVTPGQTNVTVDLFVDPGLVYDLECYAVNGFNAVGFQIGVAALILTVSVPADTDLPSANPVPSTMSAEANPDGSFDIELTWDPYVQGARPADLLILFWRSGATTQSAPTAVDKGVHLSLSATTYTFHGVNPNANYRFGLAAARKPRTGGFAVGAIQSPTVSPDWHQEAGVGNYTNPIAGVPASTVVLNAADGKTAFDGTVNYRTTGGPSNAPTPTDRDDEVNTDGSVSYTLEWQYIQGTRKADGFFVFVKDGDGEPALTDPHFEVGAQNSGTSLVRLTLKGFPSDKQVSFGVSAFRRTDNHLEIGAIQSPTTSPDWRGVSAGKPNYVGDIFGLEQHTIKAQAAGQSAGNYARVFVDTVEVYNSGFPRSWHLIEINSAGQKVFSDVFDVYDKVAEVINFRLEYNRRSASNVLVALGAHEPQTRRLANETYMTLVCASGNTFGRQQTVSGLTGGATYTLSGRIYFRTRTAGQLNLDVQGSGIDTSGIVLTATNTQFVRFSETFTLPSGTTSVNVRFFGDATPNFTAHVTDIFLVAGSTAESGTNLVSNGSFADGLTGWNALGTQGGGDSVFANNNNPDTGLWGVLGCLKDMGGSATLLKSSSFQFRSAYACIGKRGIGEGNGIEAYAGKVPGDTTAKVELTAQIQSGTLVAVSGTGWQPTRIPGPPTNNPYNLAITHTTSASGERQHKLTWSYDQPAMEGENRLADGFILFYKATNTSNPDEQQVRLNVEARAYTFNWSLPAGSVVSYAIQPFRYTTSGVEGGTKTTTAAWQNVAASLYVQSLDPGPPTNNISAIGISNIVTETGAREHKLIWSYTQGTLPADGFIIRYQKANTATPNEQFVEVSASVRAFTFLWSLPQGAVVSYGIQAFRRTVNGVEYTNPVTGGVWQNVPASYQVQTGGVGNDQVTSSKRQQVGQLTGNHGTVNAGASVTLIISHSVGRIPLWTVANHTTSTTILFTGGDGDTSSNIWVRCYNYGTVNQSGTVTVSLW
jgi:hypothetical protein